MFLIIGRDIKCIDTQKLKVIKIYFQFSTSLLPSIQPLKNGQKENGNEKKKQQYYLCQGYYTFYRY